ncbi:MAG: dipeptidase [Bacteroidota bacterium]|nr:dipeptidase [Bacteroidota bacterium]
MIPKLTTLTITLAFLCLPFQNIKAQNSTEALIQKAKRIHEKALTVDSHTDTPLRLSRSNFDAGVRNDYATTGSCVDFPRMKEGGLDGVFFAVFTSQGKCNEEAYTKIHDQALHLFDAIHQSVRKNKNLADIALNPEQFKKIAREGKRAVFIGVENGYPLGTDLSRVKEFYDLGARYITLCHVKNNQLCDSSNDTLSAGGLTQFGVEVVKEMNRLGMMVDVSHISDRSFYDVLKITKVPVIASHSCARAICNNPRNMTDDMLRALAANGGVIQMCILSDYVKKPKPNPERDAAMNALKAKYTDNLTDAQLDILRKERDELNIRFPQQLATVSDVVDHIDHIVKVAGIDHVGIGTDFDGGGGVADCHDVSQMLNITVELVKRGYREDAICKIWGGNLMRVMAQVENYAHSKRQ